MVNWSPYLSNCSRQNFNQEPHDNHNTSYVYNNMEKYLKNSPLNETTVQNCRMVRKSCRNCRTHQWKSYKQNFSWTAGKFWKFAMYLEKMCKFSYE